MTYACKGWYPRVNCHHIRQLVSAQRQILIRICGAYRTVSTNTIAVLAGIIPIDLLIEERIEWYDEKKNITTHTLSEQQRKMIIRTKTLEKWQQRWDEGLLDGRSNNLSYQMIPSVTHRTNLKTPIYGNMIQIITGHGKFACYLARFKLAEIDTRCSCEGGLEDAEHMLKTCNLFNIEREQLIKTIELEGFNRHQWTKSVFANVETVNSFKLFANKVVEHIKNKNGSNSRAMNRHASTSPGLGTGNGTSQLNDADPSSPRRGSIEL